MSDYVVKQSFFDIKLSKFNLFIILIVSSFLSPIIHLIPGFPAFRLEEIIIYSIFPFFILIGYFDFNKIYKLRLYILFLYLLIICFLISMTYAYAVLKINYSTNDFFEIIKVIKWIFILILASEVDFNDEKLKKIAYLFVFIYFIIFVFSILQFFNLLHINETISKYFTLEHHLYDVLSSKHRVTAVEADPNKLAALCSIGYFFFLVLIFNNKKNKYNYFFIIIGYLFTLITIILTSSRTGLIGIGFITIIFLFFTNIKIVYKIIFFLIFFLIIFLIIPYLSYLGQLKAGSKVIQINSVVQRFRMWEEASIDINRSPIFGNGISKESMRRFVDSGIVLNLRRIGIFGIIFWIMIYIYPLFFINKKNITHYIPQVIILIIFFTFIFNITNDHFSTVKLMDTYMLFMGMAISFLYRNKKENQI